MVSSRGRGRSLRDSRVTARQPPRGEDRRARRRIAATPRVRSGETRRCYAACTRAETGPSTAEPCSQPGLGSLRRGRTEGTRPQVSAPRAPRAFARTRQPRGHGVSVCTGLRDDHDVGRGPDTRLTVAERFARSRFTRLRTTEVSDSFADRSRHRGRDRAPQAAGVRITTRCAVCRRWPSRWTIQALQNLAREPRNNSFGKLRSSPSTITPAALAGCTARQPLSSLVAPSRGRPGPWGSPCRRGIRAVRFRRRLLARLTFALHRSPGWITRLGAETAHTNTRSEQSQF